MVEQVTGSVDWRVIGWLAAGKLERYTRPSMFMFEPDRWLLDLSGDRQRVRLDDHATTHARRPRPRRRACSPSAAGDPDSRGRKPPEEWRSLKGGPLRQAGVDSCFIKPCHFGLASS